MDWKRVTRRGFLGGILSSALGGVARAAEGAKEAVDRRLPAWESSGQVLKARVAQGHPPVEPLDTMVHFQRADTSTGRAMTHEILSLTHEEKGENSYPWTIYSHHTSHHTVGDACVLYARLTKEGTGWSTGLHTEVFSHGRGVSIGLNVEMTNDYAGTEGTTAIGINIQTLPSKKPTQYGLHIHGAGKHEKAIGLDGEGDVGLDVAGKYGTGIHLHGQELRLGDGGVISFDNAGKAQVRFKDGAFEFWHGDKRVARLGEGKNSNLNLEP